jgi:NTE family protein
MRVFEKESIPIDLIVGSSMGALIGGAYASGQDTYELEAKLEGFLKSPLFQDSALKSIRDIQRHDRSSLPHKFTTFFRDSISLTHAIFRQGLLQEEKFQEMINYFLPDIQFQETRILFRAVATDLVSGHLVTLSHGSLRKGVMASCAVPGTVPPQMVGEKLLADGGIICMVPTDIVRKEGADFDHSKDLIEEGERAAREKLLYIRKALPLRRRLRLLVGL